MRRRDLISLLGGVAVWPVAACTAIPRWRLKRWIAVTVGLGQQHKSLGDELQRFKTSLGAREQSNDGTKL
jgi:hypothetical protein